MQKLTTYILALSAPVVVAVLASSSSTAVGDEARGKLKFDRLQEASFQFRHSLGDRVKANVDKWLLAAPKDNPGLLDMFARRDAGKRINLVPWAGEFVGKYLISGVQAMRMSADVRLRKTLSEVVSRLLALQAPDGYLGPWPKRERLAGHWDLWGHYHVMLGLMLWHEHTGDDKAMQAVRKAADLICKTYLDTNRRVHQAGSHEMNMSVIHVLARLGRKTGEKRYLRMSMDILEDFEKAGDYFRTGLKGTEFFRTPKPRWESLHALQGMVELYRITGDERFRKAFLHHWASMRRFDMRNTGGFSSGEKATGNPYANSPIETCCVIAWETVMLDALRLTGDATIADDIELTTFNALTGAQHPSGAWCTYDTPMNGRRIPSHVSIRFQARKDTPGLNCCSVNGPRGLGMLSEWAVMSAGDRIVVNYYGPMRAKMTRGDKTPIAIDVKGDYPIGDTASVIVDTTPTGELTLCLRIPKWSTGTRVSLNGRPVEGVKPGTYLQLRRRWSKGDKVTLRFNLAVRYVAGDLEQLGRISLYRGPILLTNDERFAAKRLASLDASKLGGARLAVMDRKTAAAAGEYPPWLLVDVPAADGTLVRLCDFASAGATGRGYRSWLAAEKSRPPAPVGFSPANGQGVATGAIRFRLWRPIAAAKDKCSGTILISDSPAFKQVALRHDFTAPRRTFVPSKHTRKLKPGVLYYWKTIARNAFGSTESIPPHRRFVIDPTLAPEPDTPETPYGQRTKDQMVVHAPLAGEVKPAFGRIIHARGWKPAPGVDGKPKGAIELDGKTGRVVFGLAAFPERDFTVSIWVAVTSLPKTNYGQVFSAWCRGMDDPLRLVVHKGRLHARIEAGKFYGTEGLPIQPGRWFHVAAVKQGPKLTLYVNGKAHASTRAPETIRTLAEDFAIGGNPHFSGPEYLAARLADLRFYAKALSVAEVGKIFKSAGTR
ncbi:MAG: glycoside hydrolase family 127 protein [Phycisphaerae bacterium]|nr:glycoside hydrolase family 127 protein [Phycisphaerae bacterium]